MPEIERLERLAERLRAVEPYVPPPGAKIRGWNLVLAAVEQSNTARLRVHPIRRLVLATLAATVLLVAGAVAASADSLPDSIFYPLKGVLENTRGALTLGASDQLAYHLDLARTRMTEAQTDEIRQRYVDMTPAGRFGTAEEVAAVIAFLVGPDAGYVNGAVIPVDGGLTA